MGKLSHEFAQFGKILSTLSSWLVVALTVDRLILSKLPTKAQTLSTPKRAYLAIAAIVLLSVAINAPYLYENYEVKVTVNQCSGYWTIPLEIIREDNSTYTPIRYRESYQLYANLSSAILFYVCPTAAMIVCNYFVIKLLRSEKFGNDARNRKQSQKRRAELRLTKMVIVVSVCFIICTLPDVVTQLLWRFLPASVVGKVQQISHLFLMVNVGANFVVYSLLNKRLITTISALFNKTSGRVRGNQTDVEQSSPQDGGINTAVTAVE